MTWLAPASRYLPALSGVMPPAGHSPIERDTYTCAATRQCVCLESIPCIDSNSRTANLQSLRVRAQRGQGRLLAAGAQHDDVPALELVLLVHAAFQETRGGRRISTAWGAAHLVFPLNVTTMWFHSRGKVRRAHDGLEVGDQRRVVPRERGAHDLLHLARVDVDAGAEHHD